MYGINLSLPVHLYTDASGYAAGLAVTQFQDATKADVPATKEALVEVPIIYDSFSFNDTQRKYPTYKRELCAIVKFVTKYDYLCKHPFIPAVVHTDHKPLTHFLKSDLHEGIYGHWADQMRRLNLSIQYIPGHRNKVADALSRTLFHSSDYSEDPAVVAALRSLADQGPRWVWKDGKEGFEAFLAAMSPSHKQEIINHGTMDGVSVFALTIAAASATEAWPEAYQDSVWFGDVYKFLTGAFSSPSPRLVRRAYDFRISSNGILWIHLRGTYLPCIPEAKILAVLREAHDDAGHWGKAGTLARLRGLCYWPGQSQDVDRYISGCIECARHGPATRSQLLHPVQVTYPFQLMGMDFIGPLPKTASGTTYILNLVCYATKFIIPFATRTANVEDVLWCLRLFFAMYRKPQAFYVDSGHHFNNDVLRDTLKIEGIAVDFSPSGASKSTGMVELSNKLLEQVLRKGDEKDWDVRLPKGASGVNQRIIGYLGLSPSDLLFGPVQSVTPVSATLLALPNRDLRCWAESLADPAQHAKQVSTYLKHRADLQDTVHEISKKQKEETAMRYNKGVKQVVH